MDNYEAKMQALANCRPEKKDELLMKIVKGEKVDITKDEDLFYQVNKDRMSMEDFVNRGKFIKDAKDFKESTKNFLTDTKHGKTNDKKGRYLGDIPAEIYYARKELSDPTIPKHERDKAIRKFFNDFPAFRAGEKQL